MKKFIIRGSCFLAIGLMLLSILNYFYTRTNGFKSIDDTYKFYDIPDEIAVANLGSSHAEYAFDYGPSDGLVGFNFALPGQNFYLDLQILKKYNTALSDGCVLVIPISYFSFVQPEEYNNQRTLYYRILDYGSIPNHKPVEYMRFKLLPVLTASFNIKYLIKDKDSVEFFLIPGLPGDSEDEFVRYARIHHEYYLQLMEEGGDREFNTGMLEEIIEFSRQIGCRPVLVTTPFTRYYNEEFSGSFYGGFYETVNDISERHDVPYLDYSHDPRFAEAIELFVDSDHLNEAGRRTFTMILLGDLGLI